MSPGVSCRRSLVPVQAKSFFLDADDLLAITDTELNTFGSITISDDA